MNQSKNVPFYLLPSLVAQCKHILFQRALQLRNNGSYDPQRHDDRKHGL